MSVLGWSNSHHDFTLHTSPSYHPNSLDIFQGRYTAKEPLSIKSLGLNGSTLLDPPESLDASSTTAEQTAFVIPKLCQHESPMLVAYLADRRQELSVYRFIDTLA